MARHYIGAAKPKPEKPRAEIRAAPSSYETTHPVGSAERFLDQAAKDALAAAAAGGVPPLSRFIPGAARAVAKEAEKYPDPLLSEAAGLPAAELAKRAARAEAYRQAMEAQNEAVRAAATVMSPVGNMVVNQTGATAHDALTRQDALGGDTGSETAVSETPVSEAPQNPGGPRIVINPTTFRNNKDALCVAFNEGFRVWMEANDFQPQSEPTDAQRKFFSDTAYADDEVQLRRTILARIATFDTSVKDPTDDQLSETAGFLNAVLESDWCRNDWERNSVQKLARAVEASVGAEPVEPKAEPLEAREEAPLEARAALGGGETDEERQRQELARVDDQSNGQDLETESGKGAQVNDESGSSDRHTTYYNEAETFADESLKAHGVDIMPKAGATYNGYTLDTYHHNSGFDPTRAEINYGTSQDSRYGSFSLFGGDSDNGFTDVYVNYSLITSGEQMGEKSLTVTTHTRKTTDTFEEPSVKKYEGKDAATFLNSLLKNADAKPEQQQPEQQQPEQQQPEQQQPEQQQPEQQQEKPKEALQEEKKPDRGAYSDIWTGGEEGKGRRLTKREAEWTKARIDSGASVSDSQLALFGLSRNEQGQYVNGEGEVHQGFDAQPAAQAANPDAGLDRGRDRNGRGGRRLGDFGARSLTDTRRMT